MRWDAKADLEARAELGVGLEAGPEEVREAYEAISGLLMAEGKTLALERATAAYRTLTAGALRTGHSLPRRRLRWVAAGVGLAALIGVGLLGSLALRPPPPAPGTGLLATPSAPAPSPLPTPTPSSLDPRLLVLSAADLGPEYSVVRVTPAVLGPVTSNAHGWDAVFRSTTGTVVESIAVVYPTANEAADSATAMNGIPSAGTARVARAIGPVLVIAVVAPDSDQAGNSLAQQVSILEVRRVVAAAG